MRKGCMNVKAAGTANGTKCVTINLVDEKTNQ